MDDKSVVLRLLKGELTGEDVEASQIRESIYKKPLDSIIYSTDYTNTSKLPSSCYTDQSYNCTRRATMVNIGIILKRYKEFSTMESADRTKMISQIEISIFSQAFNVAEQSNIRPDWNNDTFVYIYGSTVYKVLSNLDVDSFVASSAFCKKVISGEIKPDDVGKTTSDEMCPWLNFEIKQAMDDRKKQKMEFKGSKLFKCHKCNSSCFTERIFNRSADEGTNFKIKCASSSCGAERFG